MDRLIYEATCSWQNGLPSSFLSMQISLRLVVERRGLELGPPRAAPPPPCNVRIYLHLNNCRCLQTSFIHNNVANHRQSNVPLSPTTSFLFSSLNLLTLHRPVSPTLEPGITSLFPPLPPHPSAASLLASP